MSFFLGGHCGWDQVIPMVAQYFVFVAVMLAEDIQYRGGSDGCIILPLSVLFESFSKREAVVRRGIG